MITSKRCEIRRFQEKDLDAFISYRNNQEWMKYQSFKNLSKEQYRKILLDNAPFQNGVQLAIIHSASSTLIGDLYLQKEDNVCWIGYTISPNYARRGFAAEAVTALLAWLQTHQQCAKAFAGVDPENLASIFLLKKLGFLSLGLNEETQENIYSFDLNMPR